MTHTTLVHPETVLYNHLRKHFKPIPSHSHSAIGKTWSTALGNRAGGLGGPGDESAALEPEVVNQA
jgi:hypothetical protein